MLVIFLALLVGPIIAGPMILKNMTTLTDSIPMELFQPVGLNNNDTRNRTETGTGANSATVTATGTATGTAAAKIRLF